MHKKRVIGVILLKDQLVVQSVNFSKFLPIGNLSTAIEYFNKWCIDELIVLDIDAPAAGFNVSLYREAFLKSQTPLALGGGISCLDQMRQAFVVGADKVVVNSSFFESSKFITEATKVYGSQSVIVSVDVKYSDGHYNVVNRKFPEIKLELEQSLKRAERCGAGEIFINSVDNDGMKQGYDLPLIDIAKSCVSIPIIICGGVGQACDLSNGLMRGADAVAASNFFHYTELSVVHAKRTLFESGFDIRF